MTTIKRQHSADDVDMDLLPLLPGAEDYQDGGADMPIRPSVASFLQPDHRPDDFAHAGLRRGIALALDHVGFDGANPIAVESFALATEECMYTCFTLGFTPR
jgi:hypothetical protein